MTSEWSSGSSHPLSPLPHPYSNDLELPSGRNPTAATRDVIVEFCPWSGLEGGEGRGGGIVQALLWVLPPGVAVSYMLAVDFGDL